MLNFELKINGKQVGGENEVEAALASVRFTCEIGDKALEVEFSEDRAAFVGWLNGDEEIFYFDNGSGKNNPVDLIINVCPEERMMCCEPDTIKNIVYYFCETGERDPRYRWIEDSFE